MATEHVEKLLVVDFGSQFTQLVARRLREAHVYCEIHGWDTVDEAFLQSFKPQGIVLSGGPSSVNDVDAPRAADAIWQLGVPVLGICYGMQTMAKQLGGVVHQGDVREFGFAQVECPAPSPSSSSSSSSSPTDISLFDFFGTALDEVNERKLDVWMSHGDQVVQLPEGFQIIGRTKDCAIAAMADLNRKFFAVQFHPEVRHTKRGDVILQRFVADVCQCHGLWTMHSFASTAIEQIRQRVGSEKVLLGLSGGVDSSVAAALIHRAIGDQLVCVFVDHGLLRLNEAEQVMSTFAEHLHVQVIHVDASDEMFTALEGVDEPEQKRRIIGRLFVDVFQREANKGLALGSSFLAQGTIYPDVIESAGAKSNKAHTIKSHHNVGGLPDTLKLTLLEPLRELFKDEVRELGIELGLPATMVYRHPFPGPGLGVRILGAVTRRAADLLRKADAIFIEELRASSNGDGKTYYELTSQAFVVFLPIRSVGVMGDGRTYENAVALRAVDTTDFMTATWSRLPFDLLAKVSHRITNEVRGINRVVFDISGKPPATIEWE